jgi:hypothetical protein
MEGQMIIENIEMFEDDGDDENDDDLGKNHICSQLRSGLCQMFVRNPTHIVH